MLFRSMQAALLSVVTSNLANDELEFIRVNMKLKYGPLSGKSHSSYDESSSSRMYLMNGPT